MPTRRHFTARFDRSPRHNFNTVSLCFVPPSWDFCETIKTHSPIVVRHATSLVSTFSSVRLHPQLTNEGSPPQPPLHRPIVLKDRQPSQPPENLQIRPWRSRDNLSQLNSIGGYLSSHGIVVVDLLDIGWLFIIIF